MATDLDKLHMANSAALAAGDTAAGLHNSCSLDTTVDASMCSSSMMSKDDSCDTSTPQSKRQRRLPPLEVPDSSLKDSLGSLSHRLSESGTASSQRIAQHTPKGQRPKDEFNKPPVSPNDPCLGMDLRKAALLRSLMRATDPPQRRSSRQKQSAVNAWQAHGSQKTGPLSNADAVSDGAASMDVDGNITSDADCSPNITPSVSPDRTSASAVISAAQSNPALRKLKSATPFQPCVARR